ncbi:MAG: MFS transporter [Chloroflexi bacterium]|nr:MFS transporter [Chloroflexota bacterium]
MADRTSAPQERREGVFYGWYIVGALFFATFVGVGSRQGFGVFVEAWEEDFGVSVGAISVAAGVGWVVNGLVQPFFGRLTDAFGGRRVLVFGLLAMGLGTLSIAAVPNVYVLIAVYGFVVSAAAGGVFPTPASSVIVRWFQRKRGTAMSMVAFGGSAGGLIMVPFAAYLLVIADWRTAWLVMGGIILLLGLPLLVTIVRSDPADMGLTQDGDDEPADGTAAGHGESITARVAPLATSHWRESYRSAPMWQLSLAYSVCGVTTAIIAVHFIRWASTENISPGTAALAFGALMAINGLGLLVVGTISDRMQRKNLLGAVYLIRGLAFLALVVLPGVPALWVFAVVGGMSWLATVPLTNSLAADVYGLRNVGVLNGLIMMAHQLAGGLAVIIAGIVFDIWDTYDPVFAASAIFLVLAGLISFAIRERRYSIRYQPPVPAAPVAAAASDGD